MADNHAHAASSSSDESFVSRHYFVIRRLHSLSGLMPVGVFLCVHLFANSSILLPSVAPGEEFQRTVNRIHALGPLLLPVEIIGIFVPIAFHALLGLQIIFTARHNIQNYPYSGNVRYSLQRATGVIAFFFILYHVWHMHWLGAPMGGGVFDPHAAPGTAAAAIQKAWWIAPLYAIGVVSCVFHLANGVWTSLITWGITIRPSSQRTAGYVCAVFGVVLGLVGLGALSGFRTFRTDGGAAGKPVATSSH